MNSNNGVLEGPSKKVSDNFFANSGKGYLKTPKENLEKRITELLMSKHLYPATEKEVLVIISK